ncbi:hypothetical protein [Nocardia amamiensis]|uniref:hypothetical protein n=1 Tax=Nocardia amamiensis TaxID=404578 RepID=UPI0033F0F7D8
MTRRDLVQALRRSMPDPANSVAYPDHPLLVRGPDVLARDETGLVAYFVYADSDPKPGSATGRAHTLLSRLAFPDNTLFVLVAASREVVLTEHDVELFDRISYGIPSSQFHRGDSGLSGFQSGGIVAELKPFHMQRFGDTWATRDSDPSIAQPDRIPISIISHRTDRRRIRLPQNIGLENGQLFAWTDPTMTRRSSISRQVSRMIAIAVDVDYPRTLDGLSTLVSALHSHKAYLPVHHLRTPEPEASRVSDILKPYRAAAFAGFHTMIGGH